MIDLFKRPGFWVVVAVAAILATLHLPYPFTEDQATFTWGAQAMSEGARYYRDFWDVKQPGIYWWYELAGRLFGFDTFGIRWMDLLWAVVVAPIVWAATRRRGELAGVLAACLSFGAFYAKTGPLHLSQLEWLIGGPLAIILWCLGGEAAAKPGDGRVEWRYAWVGVMVTVVATFKLMVVLVPVSMLLVALGHSRWSQRQSWHQILRAKAVPTVVGAAASSLLVVAWLALDGTLYAALWAAFVYPPQALREYVHGPLFRLEWSFHWFRRGNIWLAPWAIWAVWMGIRHARRLELICIAWGLSALLVISMQLLSYWEYHFDLLFMPLGVLAALGFCDVLQRLTQHGRPVMLRLAVVAAMLVSVAACMLAPLTAKTLRFARAIPFTPERLVAFEAEVDGLLPILRQTAPSLDRLSSPHDRVVIWGDQRLYALIDRRPVLLMNGNTRFLREQLTQAVDQLRQAPPPLIYIGAGRDVLTLHDGGSLTKLVQDLYVRCGSDDLGNWYRPRAGGC